MPDKESILKFLRDSGDFEGEEIESTEARIDLIADGDGWFPMKELEGIMPDEETATKFRKTQEEKAESPEPANKPELKKPKRR